VRLGIHCSSFPDELHVSLSWGLKNRQLCIFINLTAESGEEKRPDLWLSYFVVIITTAPRVDQKRWSSRWPFDVEPVMTAGAFPLDPEQKNFSDADSMKAQLLMELLAICFLSKNGTRVLSVESKRLKRRGKF